MPSYGSMLQDKLDAAHKENARLAFERDRLAELLTQCMDQGLSSNEADQARRLLKQIYPD